VNDYKLKLILTILSGIVFSLVIIILALVLPVKEEPKQFTVKEKPKNKLEAVSKSFGER